MIGLPPGVRGWLPAGPTDIGHWSGAPSRLRRDLTGRFGGEGYAEELRAELASCFIGTELGLPCDVPNHASYVADWLEILRGDKREVFRAAADAQRVADYLGGFHPNLRARRARAPPMTENRTTPTAPRQTPPSSGTPRDRRTASSAAV